MRDIPKSTSKTAPRHKFARHPLVENVPTLPASSAGFMGILESIKSEGIREPLKCVANGEMLLVVDGIHRLEIAESLQMQELPYIEVASEDAVTVVCSSLIRAEWTKSALAYRMWPMFAACALKPGGDRKSKGNHFPLISAAEIAKKMGVSKKLVDQAKRLHTYFSKYPDARVEQEGSILTGNLPLHKAGPDAEKSGVATVVPIRAIESSLDKLRKSFSQWHDIAEPDRERARNKIASALHQLPRDIQETAIDALEIALGR